MGCCQSDERDNNIINDKDQVNFSFASQVSSSNYETEKTSENHKESAGNQLRYDQIIEKRQKMVSYNHLKFNHGYINVNVINTPKTDFFSQYTMGKFLGQGGFGTVCVGVQKTTNVKRAIKMVSKVTLTERDKMILLEELALLKSIDHPNILKILEHYEDEQHHFFVTELLSGGELFNKIMELNGFDEKQASGYMRQILSAVSYCHSQNIVHRDLKPENILFTSKKSNQIKVIDFGCSTKFDKSKKIKDIAGTVLYLAPEVIKKSLYDEKCDIWSLGVVMYIMLCGYPPFDGQTDDEVFNEIQNKPVSFEGEEWEKISQEAKDLIQKMLQKDPNLRISAAQAYQHPWIQKRIKNSNLQENLMKNLAQFSARNKVKTALLNMITLHILKNKEKQEIIHNFQQLDKDGDGQLSKEELIEGYERLIGDRAQAERIVELVFKEIDYDGSGQVSFQEFLVATANKEQILTKENLLKAFDLIDEDRNGFITQDELEKVVGGTSLNDQVWEQMMKECDVNGDGKIDKTEFVDLIVKWLERDLFKAKEEFLQAEDKKMSRRKGSAPLIQQQYSPPRQQTYNNSLSQFDNRFSQKIKYQNTTKKSLDNNNKGIGAMTSSKGPSYNLYNNYYNNTNFYQTHKSMIKSQAPSNNASNRASYMTQSLGANKFMKSSGNKSIQLNGLNETESQGSYYPAGIDTLQSQQLNQELNSLSHLPVIKSPKLTSQSPTKKINTVATIKTFYPASSVNSSLNSKNNL